MPRVANIDERGRRRRLIGGAVWLATATVATWVMSVRHVREGWYWILIVPFTLAALGYFQARERT